MDNKLLFIDVETGGLDPEVSSLLTVSFSVYKNGKVLGSRDFLIKHDVYNVTVQALEVNHINLIELDKIATHAKTVVKEIISFIRNNSKLGELPVVAGHGVDFDIRFLDKLFRDNGEKLSDYISHRKLDTCGIINFLKYTGKIDIKSASLESAIEYFNIDTNGRHVSRDDVDATIKVYEKLNELINIDKGGY